MIRDSAATKARILDAATAEFAAHGLAGARVDRIAKRAESNKQLIYAYFESKEKLFDRTLEANIDRVLSSVPFDTSDLPGYAESLYDFNNRHPELVRLMLWHSLERPGMLPQLPQFTESMALKLQALTDAQDAGTIDASLAPQHLLALLLGTVHSAWTGEPAGTPREMAARRRALGVAIRRLTAPA